MNFDQDDVLFGLGEDPFACNSPMGDAAYNDPSRFDHMADAIGDDLGGMQYDNSLAVPMDDYQFPNDMQGGDSRDFQTLQPPVSSAYDMDMGNSQSSMGMGGYSNGGTNEGLLYEQTTAITNGDHHMMGAEEHYGMPGTSFGSYQPSPMEPDHHSSPSVSRQHSRPASRTPAQKAPGLVKQLNAPSTSSYSNSPTPTLPPPPVKSAPAKKAPPRPANGSRKKHPQSQNTVGAVLTKVHKLAATPAASTSSELMKSRVSESAKTKPAKSSLRLSPEEAMRVAALTQEIEQLQQVNTPHSRARQQSLSDERAQIFFNALASQNVSTVASQPAAPPTRPRVSHKKQQPQQPPPPVVVATSPTYTPQCATVYTPADGYAAVPGPSQGYAVTPSTSQPMQQRGTVYKVNSAPGPQLQQQHGGPLRLGSGGPGSAGGPPPPQAIYVQQQAQLQQLQPLHGQPPPQMVMTSSTPSSLSSMPLTSTPVIVPGRGKGRTMQLHHATQHQQQHRSSPMPSTSTASQPQPLLQLSLPVQQQQQQHQRPMRMDDSQFRPNPQQTARRMEEKRQGRQRRLQNAFDIMSAQLLTPETEVPFAGVDDIFKRLMPYHLLYEHDMDPNLEEEFDLQFARAMVDADEKRRVITDRMRRIAFNEAMARKDEELNLLLYLDAEWERGRLEEERKMAKDDPESLRPIVRTTALSLMDHREEKPPTEKMKALIKPEGAIPLSSSLYEYHPFVERRRIPTPPPPGPLHGLEESDVEEDTEDEKVQCVTTAAAAAGPSSSFPTKQLAQGSDEDDDDLDEASPEMGWQGTADDLQQRRPTTVPPPPSRSTAAASNHSSLHRPAAAVPERVVVKQDVASPRPAAAAAGKVQPAQPLLRVESPARTKITVGRSTTGQRHDMPEAIPVPLAKRNRMAEERAKEEERRKKVEEREREAAEKRRRGEEERKERERRGREEERQREREKEERRKREEAVEEQRRVIMPLKIKLKPLPCPREEEKKEEERRDEEERENREKKSKKKRKKEKRRAEEGDEEEERERKRRKKEKKERERQAAAAAAAVEVVVPPPAAAAAASTMTTPAIPKLKIKYGGAATPAATPAAAAANTPRQPAAPLAAAPSVLPLLLSVAPPTTPVQPLQTVQQPSPAPPTSGLKLKIKLGPPTTGPPTTLTVTETSPAKDERKREKKEKRRENGHHREKDREKHHHHHHKRKEHSYKEHRKSESRHHEQPTATAEAPTAPPKQPAAASQPPPPVPSVKHFMPSLFRPSVIAAPPQLQPTMQLLQQQLGLPQPVLPQLPVLPMLPAVPRQPNLPPGMVGLPPGFQEPSPERVAFSDDDGEDDERSNALTKSAADITRMVVPSLLHRLPQLQQVPPSFNRNNQYP
ncbi:mig-38 [Pristionchus pacificus]|uniref:Mig-38 n=1 Tax=Pristionchus pacificus TaxID=54126 RepID=A0A2A6BH71_PRIPA|nr:mig-38 [Pristionchus pacificus]|eukprot:PDM65250.1 mig-38 [Pristionchus pacificus]